MKLGITDWTGRGKDSDTLELVEEDPEAGVPAAAPTVLDTRPGPHADDPGFSFPRPSCTAAWLLPVLTIVAVGSVGAAVNAMADDFYAGLIAGTATCAAILLLTIIYNLGRVLQARYHTTPYVSRFFYVVFLPVSCLRWNATEVVAAAAAPPSPGPVRDRAD